MAHIKHRPFVNSRDVLLIYMQNDEGQYILETEYLHVEFATVQDVHSWMEKNITFPEQIQRIVRFDTEVLKGEDVTEDFSEALAEYELEVA